MNKEILERIDQLASKLNTTAEHLWQVMVAQARVEIIERLFFIAFFLAVIFALVKTAKRFQWKRVEIRKTDRYGGDDYLFIIVASWVLAWISVIFVAVTISTIPTLFLNPEFWALDQLLGSALGK